MICGRLWGCYPQLELPLFRAHGFGGLGRPSSHGSGAIPGALVGPSFWMSACFQVLVVLLGQKSERWCHLRFNNSGITQESEQSMPKTSRSSFQSPNLPGWFHPTQHGTYGTHWLTCSPKLAQLLEAPGSSDDTVSVHVMSCKGSCSDATKIEADWNVPSKTW